MAIKGIIFSKDGTILEFNNLWLNSTIEIVEKVIASKFYQLEKADQAQLRTKALEALGIRDGQLSDSSILPNGTVRDIAEALMEALGFQDEALDQMMEDYYYHYIKENKDQIKGIIDLKDFFERLERYNYKVAIATNNSRSISQMTLDELGIRDTIDFIATYDEYPKKPDPFTIDEFAERFYLKREEIIVVGDSKTDMLYAQHAAYGVGVLTGTTSEEFLKNYTAYIIPDISYLLDEQGEIVFEKERQAREACSCRGQKSTPC